MFVEWPAQDGREPDEFPGMRPEVDSRTTSL